MRASGGWIGAAADHWLARLRAARGQVDTLDLPASGIAGNSHLLMMDDNASDIAAMVAAWIEARLPPAGNP